MDKQSLIKDDRKNINNVIASHQPKTQSFNPMETRIQTLEVNDKTLGNYISQIKNNIYVGFKSMFFVARDVYDAKVNLSKEDYKRLIENFKWNDATVSKMESIGRSNNLMEVYQQGNLPQSWTTLYYLSSLTDDKFQKVKSLLSIDTPLGEIKNKLNDKTTSDPNWLLNFLNLEIDKRKVTVAEFANTLSNIKKDLKKYKVVKVKDDEDKQKRIEKSIASYIKSQQPKDAKDKSRKRKSKEITRNAA